MEKYIFNSSELCMRGNGYSKKRGVYSKWEQKLAQNVFSKSIWTKLNGQTMVIQHEKVRWN